MAARLLAAQECVRVWVYRFLPLVVVLAIAHLMVVDAERYLLQVRGRGMP